MARGFSGFRTAIRVTKKVNRSLSRLEQGQKKKQKANARDDISRQKELER
jgi:hypothetical protein